jgi:hypothetical protein
MLRMENVADFKVRKITGHMNSLMTEHYTQADSKDFKEVLEVQSKLFEG